MRNRSKIIKKCRISKRKSILCAIFVIMILLQKAQAFQWERIISGNSPGVRILDEDPLCWFSPSHYWIDGGARTKIVLSEIEYDQHEVIGYNASVSTNDGYEVETHVYNGVYNGSRVTAFQESRFYPASGNRYQIDVSDVSYTTDGTVLDGYYVVVSLDDSYILPLKAIDPSPSDEMTYMSVYTDLNWSSGGGAAEYDIYFGTDQTPDESEYQGTQSRKTYDPGILLYGTTYYWRIDSKNNHGKTVGDVWSFTTTPSEVKRTIYVDDDAYGSNDGSSWINAYASLQDALAAAYESEVPVEVLVAKGIYKPDYGAGITTNDRNATFKLQNNIALIGGYAGIQENDPDRRDISMYVSVLNGDLKNNDINTIDLQDLHNDPANGDNSYHVVDGSGVDSTAVIDGFSIVAGNANGDSDLKYGGAMFNNNGNPTVSNCSFSRNAADYGGGMYNRDSSPIINDCIFNENFSDMTGGGIRNVRGNPMLTNCAFMGNFADMYGGGIDNFKSNLTLSKCIFSENRAASSGGGMNNSSSNLDLTDCKFTKNFSNNDGGGMICNGDSIQLANCCFISNISNDDGGGLYNQDSDPYLVNCTFSGNVAENEGGGMGNHRGHPTLTNCLFCGNTARYGGGIACVKDSYPTLVNCTLTENQAEEGGGGIYNWIDGTTIVTNCILWNNSQDQIKSALRAVSIVEYSDIQGGYPGQGNIDMDPLFADTGYWDANGTTENQNEGLWIDGDYHLKSKTGRWDPISEIWIGDVMNSPCIDRGDSSLSVGSEPEPNGGRINMGTYGGTDQASMSLY